MADEDDEEEAYNAEVERLMNEGMRCPQCDATPVEVEVIEDGEASMVTCTEGHFFLLEPTEGEPPVL